MTALEYFKPANLDDALKFLSDYGPDTRVYAGGSDILVNLRNKSLKCKYLLDIKGLPEMQELKYIPGQGLTIGGAITINQLVEADQVQQHYPILVEAGNTLGSILVRNRATMMGNICNASPGADMAPATLVLDGKITVASRRGKRKIAADQFFLGVKRTVLEPDELAISIEFPEADGRGIYLKKRRVKGHDLSQVGVAAFWSHDNRLRLALGSVATRPLLFKDFGALKHEDLLRQEKVDAIVETVLAKINPINDQRASREYRLAISDYLIRHALELLGEGV